MFTRITPIAVAAGLIVAAAAASPAFASDPVPREVTGCVNGATLKADGYIYSVRVVVAGRWRDVDLTAFEGMTIRVGGALLPGDVLHMQRLEIIAPDCREGGGK